MDTPPTWHHRLRAPARDDAPGIFVKADELPDASIGDRVIVEPPPGDPSPSRAATVADVDTRDGAAFFRLEFDAR